MDIITVLLFIVGVVVLVWGADLLVRGAAHLAEMVGVSPLVVGLTVVAMGTSAPELAVSMQAAFANQTELTLGNILGSNIANILLILGLSAVVAPLLVAPRILQREVPIMIGVSLLLWFLAADGTIAPWEGLLLTILLIAFIASMAISGRRTALEQSKAAAPPRTAWNIVQNIGYVLGGLFLLVLGAQWLVNGAVAFARALGVSELLIGLTIVAVGTSLPEIATSVLASIRGEREIAVGNVVGSNIVNILGVLGLTAIFSPQPIVVPANVLAFDLPVVVATAVACLPIFFHGSMIARWEGMLFLGYYVAYTAYLILIAMQSTFLPLFTAAMLFFVIPLTLITLAVLSFTYARQAGQVRVEIGD